MAHLTLIRNADIYAPEHLGKHDVLFDGGLILKTGRINQKALAQLEIPVDIQDGKNQILTPGFIDPHAHFLGGSGENGGFSSQTPEISLTEFTLNGVTTAVGTLGADTHMKTMAGLLAKAKGYKEQGLSAYLWTGGYDVPPHSILESVALDIMFIEEIIGTGELAIADQRSSEPLTHELARILSDTYKAGMLARKAGLTHFHAGSGKRRLECITDTLNERPEVDPKWIYITHIERTKALIKEAIKLSKKGVLLDMDMAEGGLTKSLHTYVDLGGDLNKLTISSDASKTSPGNVLSEIRKCYLNKSFGLSTLLKLVTKNPAKFMKFEKKGELKVGSEASLVLFDRTTLEVNCVYSKGKKMVEDGKPVETEKFLEESNREVELIGEDAEKDHHPHH